jgi:hypothetical protein
MFSLDIEPPELALIASVAYGERLRSTRRLELFDAEQLVSLMRDVVDGVARALFELRISAVWERT